MELNKETLEHIKKAYYEWLDDCEMYNLPIDYSTEGVFNFIADYIANNSNEE